MDEHKDEHKVEIKPKPWGKEIWFAHTNKYAGKILCISKGQRFSLQLHEKKEETQYVYKGKLKLTYGTDPQNLKEEILLPGDKVEISPGLIHRLEALEDSEVFEVSTPELDDVVKLEDDYGRTGKGNDEETDKKLHDKQSNENETSHTNTREVSCERTASAQHERDACGFATAELTKKTRSESEESGSASSELSEPTK